MGYNSDNTYGSHEPLKFSARTLGTCVQEQVFFVYSSLLPCGLLSSRFSNNLLSSGISQNNILCSKPHRTKVYGREHILYPSGAGVSRCVQRWWLILDSQRGCLSCHRFYGGLLRKMSISFRVYFPLLGGAPTLIRSVNFRRHKSEHIRLCQDAAYELHSFFRGVRMFVSSYLKFNCFNGSCQA